MNARLNSVVRLQSGLDINPYLSPYSVPKHVSTTAVTATTRSSSASSSRRPSRPRSLESDVLLLAPTSEGSTRARTTSLQCDSPDLDDVKVMKRSTTVGTCQMITTTTGAQRKLLAEFNRNESEGSTSPER